MNFATQTLLAGSAVIVILAGCASEPPAMSASVSNEYPECEEVLIGDPTEETNLKQLLAGGLVAEPSSSSLPTNTILGDASGNKFLAALNDLDGGGYGTQRARLERIERSYLARGLAGVSVRFFTGAAMNTLNGNSFGAPVSLNTKGKLEAYFYDESEDVPDCIRVLMTYTTKRAVGVASPPYQLRWTIFGNFKVAARVREGERGYDPKNVFPGAETMPISETMLGDKDLNWKLWAKYRDVTVSKVEWRRGGSGPFHLVHRNNRRDPLSELYEVTEASCVDMMFRDTPPMTLDQNAKPPAYCLGRCSHPAVVNTF